MDEEENIMWLILNKLDRKNKIGGSHTELRNLTKSLPEYYTRDKKGKKVVKSAIKELTKRRFLMLIKKSLLCNNVL